MKVAILGGGVSGLAAAFRLAKAGAEVVVLEAAARPGGKILTERVAHPAGDFLIEHGPNGFLDSRAAALRLALDVGLKASLLPADVSAARRYLFLRGRLRPLPHGPLSFLCSDILSLKGRLRLLCEPFIRGRREGPDESVFDFAARRVGVEAAETLIDPMVAGIYAGDARRLSLAAAFPRLLAAERGHGSLTRGLIAVHRQAARERRKAGGPAGPAGRLTSFEGGLGALIDALARALGDALQCGRPVTALNARAGGGYSVEAEGGAPILADAVVLALPTSAAARLLAPLVPAAEAPLLAVPYAPTVVVALGYETAALPRALDGFGFLVPSRERRNVLGVLWDSVIFKNRAPNGLALLRAIVGGARSPELFALPDEPLLKLIRSELAVTLGGPLPEPCLTRVIRWPEGIPQYALGHLERRATLEAALRAHPGLHLAGNGLYGISLAECAAHAETLPAQILGAL